jgi:hypothetical protein
MHGKKETRDGGGIHFVIYHQEDHLGMWSEYIGV